MIGFFIFIHTLTAILLIVVILMQSGRGGGLTESFASAESMFGAKTNVLMVRSTVVLAMVFLVTSLTLAHLSAQREQSLIPDTSQLPQINIPLDVPEEKAQQAATEMPEKTIPVPTNAAQ